VQDIFLTETAELADVVLPAASFAEKDGTFTNTERRVQRVRKAVEPVGQSKVDWEIISELSRRIGYENKFNSASEIMDEIASLTPSYAGIDFNRLEAMDGLQWPCPTKDHPGTRYLHSSQFTREGGKATFKPTIFSEPKERPDADYPFTLMTGRVLYQYHTRTMSGKNDGLNKIAGSSYIEISSADAKRLGIGDQEKVKVSSRRGEITAKARIVADKVAPGVVFIPFHFVDGAANTLTNPVFDDTAKIPEFKACACKVERIKA
jgi:formate dehydrogenase major subunit